MNRSKYNGHVIYIYIYTLFVVNQVVANGYRSVIVFEDDIRFEPYFRRKLDNLLLEMKRLNLDWDLV